jgi:hypothetical protein
MGFKQMTKRFDKSKILLTNDELELKNKKENAKVRIEDPADYQSMADAQWQVIYDKLDLCVDCGVERRNGCGGPCWQGQRCITSVCYGRATMKAPWRPDLAPQSL